MKLFYSIIKEYKVLTRDRAGLAITFLMPTVLILIITLIQDTTFRSVSEASVPLLIIDRDNDSVGKYLEKSLTSSKFFAITKKSMTNEQAKNEVAHGSYLIGIVIPEKTSENLRTKSTQRISKLLNSFTNDSVNVIETIDTNKLELLLYFDPITKLSFKTTIGNSISSIISQIELQSMALS